MNIHVETERFWLRDIEESDVQGIFDLDSDVEVLKFIGTKPIETLKEAEAIIQYIHQQYKDNGIGRMAIEDKATGEFVGWTGLKYETIVRKEFDYYDLGYRLKRKFWGQGIASETAIASLAYGFNQLDLPRISGAANVNHVVSNRILQKVGLKFVETFEFDGSMNNWYSLSKAEWLTLSNNT